MVFTHELGHFLMAKKKGVKVEEFGFGYPPRIFGKKFGETTYSVNLLPMGGFVRVWGMEEKVKSEKERAFYYQPKKVQFLILIAGVMMNFLVSVLVFSFVYGIDGVPQRIGAVKIVEIASGSPAEKAEIKKDEVILAIKEGGSTLPLEKIDDLIKAVDRQKGSMVEISLANFDCYQKVNDRQAVCENCQCRWTKVLAREDPPAGEGSLGVVITDNIVVRLPLYRRIPLGVYYGFKEGFYWGVNIVKGVWGMVAGIFQGKLPSDFAGPIGIYKVSSEIFKTDGILAVIHFFAIVSVNLVVINLLPLPGTDGWHTGVLIFEKLRKREISGEVKRKMNQVAMIILLTLFFLVLAADIKRFILK